MAQILVLEEDRIQFEQIKQALLAKGHKAWCATKSTEAFDFCSQYSIDVILSAIKLENSDVFQFLREVKETARLSQIPFVFYCSDQERCDRYATNVIIDAGKVLGARKYILLPQFEANRFWEQLQDCIPNGALKNDSLGGQVKTYSMSEFVWTSTAKKAV